MLILTNGVSFEKLLTLSLPVVVVASSVVVVVMLQKTFSNEFRIFDDDWFSKHGYNEPSKWQHSVAT